MPRGQIRPFEREDIPQVAEVHREVFALAANMSPKLFDAYQAYFDEVFLKPVAGREDLGSLVCEEDGRIAGFLGSLPRRMSMAGRPAIARVCSQFVVHPRSRGMTGVKLLQTFFGGPQDFAIADESNSVARTLWLGLGASTCPLHSILWTCPLRPWSFALHVISKIRRMSVVFPRISGPLASAADVLTARARLNPFRVEEPACMGHEMAPDLMEQCLSGLGPRVLRPCYDADSLTWVLRRASHARAKSALQKIAVKNEKGDIAGWYVFSLTKERIAEVLQFHARTGFSQRVFGHLLYRAAQCGATAATGRLDHRLLEAVSDSPCLMRSGPWVLVHARNPEFVRAFEQGDAFFSRLEGEWCLRFQ